MAELSIESPMILGDFKDVGPTLPDNSVDLIYTDPPYERAPARPCFELLAEHAPRVLVDGGSLVTIVPHYFLEEAVGILRGALKFRWIYDMDQEEGPHPRMAMGMAQFRAEAGRKGTWPRSQLEPAPPPLELRQGRHTPSTRSRL